ncbi:MAG: acyclic terpene utilization AtuA family protein, partial [Acidimicrobiales bacterium]
MDRAGHRVVSRTTPLRVANISGYWGDRMSVAREMVDGGPVDVLTGDYLAELTMLLLYKTRQHRPDEGYARTFLSQMESVLGTCLDRGIKVVVNAGGLNPGGMARDLGVLADKLGLAPKIAHLEGDDVLERLDDFVASGIALDNIDTGESLAERNVEPLTANAYLGAWGIVDALGAGADVVICPRVTDASVVVGPAAWAFKWARDDWDKLAGAVLAGHVLECGAQATGGNYSFFQEIAQPLRPGYPIAEIAEDGSCVITKHPGTGGQVSLGTVTAQLLYEIDRPAYLNPDVITHFDSVRVREVGEDRVSLSGARGSPPTDQLKVCLNFQGGYRNSYACMLTGLDIDEKAAFATDAVFDAIGGRDAFEEVDVRLIRSDHEDAATNAEATARLIITVKDHDADKVGRRFAAGVNGIGLAIYPGSYNDVVASQASEFAVMWPALVPADLITQRVYLDGALVSEIGGAPVNSGPASGRYRPEDVGPLRDWKDEPTTVVALGRIVGARSGDKGGNANIGVWARSDDAYDWLRQYLSV